MTHTRLRLSLLMLSAFALIAACQKKEEVKPPEPTTPVTTAVSKTMDLPIVESATGSETALGFALDYDPTKVAGKTFYVRLTFPEHVGAQLRVGQSVHLTSFGEESAGANGAIREIRPALSATTMSREVIVSVRSTGNWRPVGSIRGEVTLGVHKNAVVVPEQAVVLRPSGTVVYAIENNVAREKKVKTGIARDGMVEIADGLPSGTTVAVDGAALLSDGAKINVRDLGTPGGGKS